jgi:hypothetical protein
MPFFKTTHSSLKTLLDITRSIDAWLTLDFSNVVVMHCIQGDCSSLAAACWMVYAGVFDDGAEALEYVASRRKIKVDKTLTRFAEYFSELVRASGTVPNPKRLVLNGVTFKNFHSINRPSETGVLGIQIFERGKLIYMDSGCILTKDAFRSKEDLLTRRFSPAILLQKSDILMDLTTKKSVSAQKEMLIRVYYCDDQGGPTEGLFQIALHTGFVDVGLSEIEPSSLDWCFKLSPNCDFSLQLDFQLDESLDATDISYRDFLDRNILKCLARLVVHHSVPANEMLLTTLVGIGHGRVVCKFVSLTFFCKIR